MLIAVCSTEPASILTTSSHLLNRNEAKDRNGDKVQKFRSLCRFVVTSVQRYFWDGHGVFREENQYISNLGLWHHRYHKGVSNLTVQLSAIDI